MKRNKSDLLVIIMVIFTLNFLLSAITFAQSEECKKVELVNDLSVDTVERVQLIENKTGISASSDYLDVEIEKKMFRK